MSYLARRTRGKQGVGIMGALGLGDSPPTRIVGGVQRAARAAPERCPKCQSAAVFADITEARRVYCYACGGDLYLIREG
jgi:uncharacterized protein (DUF983 family)